MPLFRRPLQEKPAEKTLFAVKLESFDASAKAKVIREVKAVMPNMNLVEVRLPAASLAPARLLLNQSHFSHAGQEVC